MAIPLTGGSEGLLPQGRHPATLEEIEALFVTAAPFPEQRALIFSAFTTWVTLVEQVLPVSRYWIDGGFTTHKTWAAPSDVDVTILCQEKDLDALGPAEQDRLGLLLTTPADGQRPRIQPMGGLVDAFVTTRGASGNAPYWNQQWSKVRGADGKELVNLSKGFLEVIA
ncbi:MAG: DUF6932 family protein [Rhodoglobus sp.]